MVILFSSKKSKTEKEIIEILTKNGGNYISDKKIWDTNGKFTVISEYKTTEIDINKGIAIIIDDTNGFKNQILPKEIIGICESENKNALKILKNNNTYTISCGINSKNTITFSSIKKNKILLSIQRTITSLSGKELDPAEIEIKLNKNYSPFSVMASAVVLLLYNETPYEF